MCCCLTDTAAMCLTQSSLLSWETTTCMLCDFLYIQHTFSPFSAELQRSLFLPLLSKAWKNAAIEQNAQAGFRGSGIYPLDPTYIDQALFSPSLTTERDEPPKAFDTIQSPHLLPPPSPCPGTSSSPPPKPLSKLFAKHPTLRWPGTYSHLQACYHK